MRMIRCLVLSLVFLCAFSPSRVCAEETDQTYIRQAFEAALSAIEQGNDPFGAVLVKDGQVIIQAANTIKTDDNITHHAETNALAAAFRKVGPEALKRSTLYTSCEPCAMCCGAIYIAGIKRLVYGLSAARLSAMTGFKKGFPSREFFHLAGAEIEITGPLLEEDAAKIIKKYFEQQEKPVK
jgi:tRNA(Arg) A34 adenosine deaminase TadA